MANKQILARYVHDAVDMETRRHTLNRLRDSIIYSREQRVYEKERIISSVAEKHQREVRTSEYSIKKLEDECSKTSQEYEKKCFSLQEQIRSLKAYPLEGKIFHADTAPIVWTGVIVFFVLGCISMILNGIMDGEEGIPIVGFIFMAICTPIACVIAYFIQKDNWKERCIQNSQETIIEKTKELKEMDDNHQNKHAKYEKQIAEKKQEYETLLSNQLLEKNAAEEELAQAQRTYDELTPHIEAMGKQLDTMDSQLNQFYEVNLIPPDYRSLECVIALDQMFRNDLVDTIREAVLLYEERVFRGEMIKGLENIRRAIGNLGALMAETISVLNRIDNNTRRMSDQLYTISSDITRMNANVTGHLSTISGNISSLGSSIDYIADSQRGIASELEYRRYANDAIRANSDRMIWYAEQRRQGLL